MNKACNEDTVPNNQQQQLIEMPKRHPKDRHNHDEEESDGESVESEDEEAGKDTPWRCLDSIWLISTGGRNVEKKIQSDFVTLFSR